MGARRPPAAYTQRAAGLPPVDRSPTPCPGPVLLHKGAPLQARQMETSAAKLKQIDVSGAQQAAPVWAAHRQTGQPPNTANCRNVSGRAKPTCGPPIREQETALAAMNGQQQIECGIVRHAAPFPVAVRHHGMQRRNAVSGVVHVRHKRRGRGGSTCRSAGSRCAILQPLPAVLASTARDAHDKRRW